MKKKFCLDVFGYSYIFILNNNVTELADEAEKYGYDEKDYTTRIAYCNARFLYDNDRCLVPILWMSEERFFEPKWFNTLTHEVSHLVSFMLDRQLGIKLSGDSDEVYAYVVGYVIEQILSFIKEKRECKKVKFGQ